MENHAAWRSTRTRQEARENLAVARDCGATKGKVYRNPIGGWTVTYRRPTLLGGYTGKAMQV